MHVWGWRERACVTSDRGTYICARADGRAAKTWIVSTDCGFHNKLLVRKSIFRTDTVTLLVSGGLTRLSLSSSSLREMLIASSSSQSDAGSASASSSGFTGGCFRGGGSEAGSYAGLFAVASQHILASTTPLLVPWGSWLTSSSSSLREMLIASSTSSSGRVVCEEGEHCPGKEREL